jgi:hypothetical protein
MKPAQLILFALLTAAVAGCGYSHLFEDQGALEPPQTGVNSLDVETGNGFVRVTRVDDTTGIHITYTRRAHGRSREDAEEHVNDIVVSSQVEGGVLKVRADWPDGARTYGCDFNVQMALRIPVDIRTSNGLIAVANTDAPAVLETTNGPIEAAGTSGPTTARSTNGAVRFTGHRGSLDAGTTNAPVTCAVEVLIPSDAVKLASTNGAVTLLVPDETQADFDASTSNAEVTVDGFPDISYSRTERTHKTGTVNGGGAQITLASSNGDVDLAGR